MTDTNQENFGECLECERLEKEVERLLEENERLREGMPEWEVVKKIVDLTKENDELKQKLAEIQEPVSDKKGMGDNPSCAVCGGPR